MGFFENRLARVECDLATISDARSQSEKTRPEIAESGRDNVGTGN